MYKSHRYNFRNVIKLSVHTSRCIECVDVWGSSVALGAWACECVVDGRCLPPPSRSASGSVRTASCHVNFLKFHNSRPFAFSVINCFLFARVLFTPVSQYHARVTYYYKHVDYQLYAPIIRIVQFTVVIYCYKFRMSEYPDRSNLQCMLL